MFQGKRNLFVQQRGLLTENQFLLTAGTPPPLAAGQLALVQPNSSAPSPQQLDKTLLRADAVVSPLPHDRSELGSGGVPASSDAEKSNPSPRKRLRFADDTKDYQQAAPAVRAGGGGARALPPAVRMATLRSWLISTIIAKPFVQQGLQRCWIVVVDDLRHTTQTHQPPAHVGTHKKGTPAVSQSAIAAQRHNHQATFQAFVDEVKTCGSRTHPVTSEGEVTLCPPLVISLDLNRQIEAPQPRRGAQSHATLTTDAMELLLREQLHTELTNSHNDASACSVTWLITLKCDGTQASHVDQLQSVYRAWKRIAPIGDRERSTFGVIVLQLAASPHSKAPAGGTVASTTSSSNFTHNSKRADQQPSHAPSLLDTVCHHAVGHFVESLVTIPMFV